MITDIAGVRVGHFTDTEARTGCTVVLLPEGTVASGEVRGGAPATREFELLRPEHLVQRLDAVVLTGGSAFGLATADGVMQACAEDEVGFATSAGAVPIVVAMGLFDLLEGDGRVRPDAAAGYRAARSATAGPFSTGQVGAGTGATMAKWRGRDHRVPGGIGTATCRAGDLIVSALMAVNSFGEIDDGAAWDWPDVEPTATAFENTTIGVIVTNATLDKVSCLVVAQGGHDGFGRALIPSHCRVDGDAVVVAATGSLAGEVDVDRVRYLAVMATERAIRAAAG